VVPGVFDPLEAFDTADVNDDCGENRRIFIRGMRLIPPDITLAPSPSAAQASARDVGAT
jgi:hypothetical protein